MKTDYQEEKLKDLSADVGISVEELRKNITIENKMDRNNNPELVSLYAIYDKKGERFDIPFIVSNDLFAKRRFLMMKDNEESPLKRWPEDFDLVFVAAFNVLTAEVVDNELQTLIVGKKEDK
jgi:hypothetical protein